MFRKPARIASAVPVAGCLIGCLIAGAVTQAASAPQGSALISAQAATAHSLADGAVPPPPPLDDTHWG